MDESGLHNITRWLNEIHDPEKAQQAWSNLVPRLFPTMVERAREVGLHVHDRESAEQESRERLFEKLQDGTFVITNRAQLFALFGEIARCKAIDKRRKLSRRAKREAEFPDGVVENLPADDVICAWLQGDGPTLEEQEEAQRLERRFFAVLQADPKLEAVFKCLYEKQLDVKSTAKTLGLSLETAHRQRRRILSTGRALRNDNDLSWLMEREPERTAPRGTARAFLTPDGQSAFDRLERDEDILSVGNTCKSTPASGFALLAHIDDVAHVVRYGRQLSELREKVRSSANWVANKRLREKVGKQNWTIFEVWCSGMNARELLDARRWTNEVVFKALREFHESAREIRETL